MSTVDTTETVTYEYLTPTDQQNILVGRIQQLEREHYDTTLNLEALEAQQAANPDDAGIAQQIEYQHSARRTQVAKLDKFKADLAALPAAP